MESPLNAPAHPGDEYRRLLEERRKDLERHSRFERLAGNGRIVAFVLGVALLGIIFGLQWLSAVWIAVPVALFVGFSVWHDRVRRACRRAARATAFYERGLARLEDRWTGSGSQGLGFLDPEHPYAADLDLFGPGSLFELLCTARTSAGEGTLASWLLRPAPIPEVRVRQESVRELSSQLMLREDLALFGADVRAAVHPEALARWGATRPILVGGAGRWITRFLAAALVATLAGWALLNLGPIPFLLVGIVAAGWAIRLHSRVLQVVSEVERNARDLGVLSGVLHRLENQAFSSERLRALQARLQVTGKPPSARIGELAYLVELLDYRRNIYFSPVALILLWTQQLAFAIEHWRSCVGPAISGWLEAVGEFEALGCLANYWFENPDDLFPELVEGKPLVAGTEIGHPLLPRAQCVRNDVHLGEDVRLLVISGSNMSGKSTFLRTIGINVVLAQAGAPVRATQFRLSPLMPGATLRVQDSLQAGKSRFYAEITRVRQLVDLARGQPPLLFLIDEIFSGTNSHDRRLGAEAIINGLLGSGAIGLVTTHDLALTQIVERHGDAAANVHFEDRFEEGAIHFDFRMRPGVVQRSNALALMRAVGLEV